MRAETEQQIVDIKQKTESQRSAFQADYEAADRVEEEAGRAAAETEQTQQKMRQEIAEVEALLAEIESMVRKRSELKTYKIPDIPRAFDGTQNVATVIESPDHREPEPSPEPPSMISVKRLSKKSQTTNAQLSSARRATKSARGRLGATKK
jgi:hypothetical protein